MARDPRYDILFEPVAIGPVMARNRFYQVPHCTGLGYAMPQRLAALRGLKAEGGWGVVCTEYCSIHPSSDDAPFPYASLWDDEDVRAQALMTEAVHAHGSLAGVQLWYGGVHSTNRLTRTAARGVSSLPLMGGDPAQTRAMDKSDIRDLRRWHLDGAKRALKADFDIVYVYAAHGYLLMQFLCHRYNQRTDEYGGSLENRARLIRELLEETKEAVGHRAAVALRFAVDELLGDAGITCGAEGRELVEMLAELPDLWDVNISDFSNDARTSRFAKEAAQEPYVDFVKQVTTKPVVGVGRFTSPDTMVSQIKRGVLDMIGAARPSIADPFLPKKIEEGRPDEIRECIGCNICIAGDGTGVPIRCTQNPTMGEEWTRGWHPERIAERQSDDSVLVIGAGPAGLECARALGQRGYEVHLAEATIELGGRVAREAKLPGLSEWIRVRDHRVHQLQSMTNVQIYRDSALTAQDVLDFGFAQVVVATGALWRKDGVGRANLLPVLAADQARVFGPDEIMAGANLDGPVVVYDDDSYYMGGVIAEKLQDAGHAVTLATAASEVSPWTGYTLEQGFIQAQLLEKGVEIVTNRRLAGFADGVATLACSYTGQISEQPCGALVSVTARQPQDSLYHALVDDPEALRAAGIKAVARIGDCDAPSTIAAAVYAGHGYARALDAKTPATLVARRERAVV